MKLTQTKVLTLAMTLTVFASLSFAETEATKIHAKNTIANTDKMSVALLEHVILRDVESVQVAVKALRVVLQNHKNSTRSPEIDAAFTELVWAWKAVQTAYVIGELDTDRIDTPRLIDAYHNGKEDLVKQLKRLLKNDDSAKVALFKNTFKSINALGFYLYADKILSTTEREYALYTLDTLAGHFQQIADSYVTYRDTFIADNEQSMSYVLNALIDSSYKLKEWRIGDPAGLSRKYKGEPDNRRQEYPYSQQSLTAIQAILRVHADMLSKRDYSNLGSTAIAQGAAAEVATIRQLISEAQTQIKQIKQTNTAEKTDFTTPAMQSLYTTLDNLNDAYYQSLVKALPVQAKILDADGD